MNKLTTTYFEDIGVVHGKHLGLLYVLGFLGSLVLTLGAYLVAVGQVGMDRGILIPLASLALLQFLLQLRTFLHLDFSRSSRDRLLICVSAIVIVCILVSGSIWIMWSLDGRMMPTAAEMEEYMSMEPGL